MTAEEMFKELGYEKKCINNGNLILYEKKYKPFTRKRYFTSYCIEFAHFDRSVDMWAIESEGIDKMRNVEFHIDDLKLFEAIQKQLKELRWTK